MTEVWKSIKGWGGYEVSNLGRVRSARQILKPSTPRNKREYPAVHLKDGPWRRRAAVHVLVAETFLGPKPSKAHEVRHLDGDHMNPALKNIVWGTRKQNATDRDRHGRTARGTRHGLFGKGHQGEKNGVAKLTEDSVRSIRHRYGAGETQADLARHFSVHKAVIWRVVTRASWRHVD